MAALDLFLRNRDAGAPIHSLHYQPDVKRKIKGRSRPWKLTANAASTNLHQAALSYLTEQLNDRSASQRDGLVHGCMKYLMNLQPITARTAQEISFQAYAELTNRVQGCYIDLQRTTSQAVFLKNPARNISCVFTASDLLRLVDIAQPGQCY